MTDPGAAPEKRADWAELLFDLVFAFAVTEVLALLYQDQTAAGLGRAALVFVPIYWTWVSTTFYANTHDVSGAGGRFPCSASPWPGCSWRWPCPTRSATVACCSAPAICWLAASWPACSSAQADRR